MSWQEHIVITPDTLFGKLRITGTRIGVKFVCDLTTSGWTNVQILESYPHLTPEDLHAARQFFFRRRGT